MTLAEQWRLEGQERGLKIGQKRGQKIGEQIGEERGLKRGEKIGEVLLIQKLLKLKFGDEASEYNNQLASFSLEQLDQISERILSCQNIKDIFKGI